MNIFEIKCKGCKETDKWTEAKQVKGWGTHLVCECGHVADTGFTKVLLKEK